MSTVEKQKSKDQPVQVYGRKVSYVEDLPLQPLYFQKMATAVVYAKEGHGLIKVNGRPLEHLQPEILRIKLQEPIMIVGADKFSKIDMRIKVKGGGCVAQIYGSSLFWCLKLALLFSHSSSNIEGTHRILPEKR